MNIDSFSLNPENSERLVYSERYSNYSPREPLYSATITLSGLTLEQANSLSAMLHGLVEGADATRSNVTTPQPNAANLLGGHR